jgi:2,3,4,5-tetrahydropyridine-2-carboxylate N-succinyltransferase
MKEIIEAAWQNRELLKDKKTLNSINEVIEQLDKGMLRVAEPVGNAWQVKD